MKKIYNTATLGYSAIFLLTMVVFYNESVKKKHKILFTSVIITVLIV